MDDLSHILTVIKLSLELGMIGHENVVSIDLEQDAINGLSGRLLWEDKEYELFVSLDNPES